MDFVELLRGKGVDPGCVRVLRHRPHEPELNKVLPWLAAERPDLFNAYQSTQGARVETAMRRARFVASFIRYDSRKALFVGLYSIGPSKPLTVRQFWQLPAHRELKTLGMKGFTGDDGRQSTLWFELTLERLFADWKGKLVVGWPPPERSWCRRAERNTFPVLAILEDAVLDKAMPRWNEIVLSWTELSVLPGSWQGALKHWRGIYYIFDASDQRGYVGSACGHDNILGRWRNYGKSGHGGNRLLRQRNPKNFQFSILERVSPDMPENEVIALESTWKDRLHTRAPRGLNDN